MFIKSLIFLSLAGILALFQSPTGPLGISGDQCVLLAPNATRHFADSFQEVIVGPGVVNLICKATDIPNDTGKGVHLEPNGFDIQCVTSLGVADDWFVTVSASGEATLVCRFRPQPPE
ncbi:hypothetical protein SAMN02745121_07556 [Nannocystis exedens]|uniref:Uncharacterized protein n=1 Tax=Nannocystis exedens TaxID=54 RepID=A0A1I2GXL5_9BACT|nr:hypothetical protein [Nannocystis exedens]PCC74045.1 hypothetical protein NAEX_07134 [Nannocystis exedens]SFF21507.1 hypothetical protein SAMN02745121_07556 [Nannocystis exedens]